MVAKKPSYVWEEMKGYVAAKVAYFLAVLAETITVCYMLLQVAYLMNYAVEELLC